MHSHGVRLGSMIGAAFGLVFVLVNAGGLGAATVVRVVGVLALVGVVVAIARFRGESPQPSPGALRVYVVAVVAEVLAIPIGAAVLRALDQPDLVLPWVVLVVGAHFGPFARAVRAPVFLGLALAMAAVGVLGGIGVLAGVDDAAAICGVVAGFVLLAGAAYGVLRPPSPTPSPAAETAS